MSKVTKVVGKISHEIAKKYDLYDYENRNIVQSLDLYAHIQKHISEFKSIDSYNNSVFNVDKIINNPYFVYYDSSRNSLQYYKEIDEFTCVVVKLNIRKNKDIYVSTIYPVNKLKIEKLKRKQLIEKYTYHGEF